MRTVFSALLLMPFCALHLILAAPLAVETANSICCPAASRVIIPLLNLESYFWTSSSCPIRHVVFKTKAKKKFCVNPDVKWVSRAIKHINQNTSSKSTK